jgi:ATP-dependent Lhr-like helicase
LLAKPVYEGSAELGFSEPTLPQVMAIPPILGGENVLLIAPTGSGKTEAVLLPIFSDLIQQNAKKGISIVYITPLRALNRDMLKRLSFWASKLGVSIEVRHGDTEIKFRRKQALFPPNMLVTTPETLQAILPGSRMKQHLSHVKQVVVDEVHELASSKRGVQLTIALERLYEITGREFQRIGLSATVANPEKVAKFIAGTHRSIKVVEAAMSKDYRYLVETPNPAEIDYDIAGELRTSPEAAARIRRITELVDSHRSTLIFVNSRQNAEMLGRKFDELKRFDIAVHHGSLSKEERARIEDEFKSGILKAIICTSTLELGIDIGNIDLVIQYLSPRQVSSLIQRVGRSGHSLDRLSEGVIVTAFPDDTLESMAAVKSAYEGELEPVLIHENALDVLAHQVAGILMDKGEMELKTLLAILRRAYPYRKLSEEKLLDVVDYLDWLNELRLKEEGRTLMRTAKTRRYYYENLSMIPDEKRYPIVNIISDRKIGTLGDEFMALKVRVGLNFICRGKVWRIVQIEDETGTVYVVPSEDPLAAIPGWDGEMLPIPYNLAQETGRMREKIAEELRRRKTEVATQELAQETAINEPALVRAVEEVLEHVKQGAPLPTHNHILLEVFDKYVIIHACFGEIVNRTLGCIFDAILSDHELIAGWWNDGYRILIETPRKLKAKEMEKLSETLFNLSVGDVEKSFNNYLEARFPFSYNMKSVAERFGALPRGKTILNPERMRQLSDQFKKTPIFDETLREAMLEKVDIRKVKEIMKDVKKSRIKVSTVYRLEKPTPLAYHILAKYSDISELMAPERVLLGNIDRMKRSIEARKTTLLCLSCGTWIGEERIRNLPEYPTCRKCGAKLLALVRFGQDAENLRQILERRLKEKELTEEELKDLTYARHTADLILSYGRKAVITLEVKGVGPETAFRILGKMHQKEDELYMDLLRAKIQYLRTREYWENKKDRFSSE